MADPLGIEVYEPSSPVTEDDRWAWDELRRVSDLLAQLVRYTNQIEEELAALEIRVAALEAGA